MGYSPADGKGYLIPDPIDPGECVCIKVYVPDDKLYIAAFWGAYQFFTSWLAWMRDPLKRGKQAAKVWRECYDKARQEWDAGHRCCDMVTNIRQNLDDPCALEISSDDGVTWVKFADLGKCSGCGGAHGSLQFDGINITQYNVCTGEYEPIGTPFNPATHGIYDSLYSDPSGKCNGAANIARWSNKVADDTLTVLVEAGLVGQATSIVMGYLISISGGSIISQGLMEAFLLMLTESSDLLDDALALAITTEMQDLLFPYMENDGTIREPKFTQAVEALYSRRDEEAVDTAERVRWGHEANILSILGPFNVSKQNKFAGITDADCSGSGWVHVFDFTEGGQGWLPFLPGQTITPEGWKDWQITLAEGTVYRGVGIKKLASTTTITKVRVEYTATLGGQDPAPPPELRQIQLFRDTTGAGDILDTADVEEGPHVWTYSTPITDVEFVAIALNVGVDATDPQTDPGGEALITKVIIEGEGTFDPYL